MINFKKEFSFKVILISLIILFLFNNMLYAYPVCRDVLRVPLFSQKAKERGNSKDSLTRFEFLAILAAGAMPIANGRPSQPVNISSDNEHLFAVPRSLGYPPEKIPEIIQAFNNEMFLTSDQLSKLQKAIAAMRNGKRKDILAFARTIIEISMKDRDFMEFIEKSPLIGFLVTNLDPTGVISGLSEEQRKNFQDLLRGCVAVSLFYAINTKRTGFDNIEYGIAYQHVFNLVRIKNSSNDRQRVDFYIMPAYDRPYTNIPLPRLNQQSQGDTWVLFYDFTIGAALYLNLSSVYEGDEDGYLTLRPELRIGPNNTKLIEVIRKLKNQNVRLTLDLLSQFYLSEQEILLIILNTYYFRIRIGNQNAIIASIARNAGGICDRRERQGERGMREKEEQCYKVALRFDPYSAEAHFNLGEMNRRLAESYFKSDNTKLYDIHSQRAIDYFGAAIALNRGYYEAYIKRGEIYANRALILHGENPAEKERQLNMAVGDFGEAIKLLPWNAEGYLKRGMARYHQGNYDTAINDIAQALLLDGDLSSSPDISRLPREIWLKIIEQKEALRRQRIGELTKPEIPNLTRGAVESGAVLLVPPVLKKILPANKSTGL